MMSFESKVMSDEKLKTHPLTTQNSLKAEG
jgi:hypothetical protein